MQGSPNARPVQSQRATELLTACTACLLLDAAVSQSPQAPLIYRDVVLESLCVGHCLLLAVTDRVLFVVKVQAQPKGASAHPGTRLMPPYRILRAVRQTAGPAT